MPKLKRVALILPQQKGEKKENYSVPVGLLSLASYIKPYGYDPIIIDLNIHFIESQGNPSGFFKKSAEKILSDDPQVLGFTVMCNTFPSALLIAEECKKLAPGIPIIFGGPEVSFEEADVLETFKQIDIIVRGEGEITLVEVLKAFEKEKSFSEILGITYREGNQIIRNLDRPFIKNLDELPYLDFSLLPDLKSYQSGYVEAGRGCPFQCTFCSSCKMWRRDFRIKSPQRLVQELRQAYHLFKKNEDSRIGLIHDNFLTSRKFANNFLSLMANENIAWTCSSRLGVLDETLIKKLKRAGCRAVYIGIETGSPEMQKMLKKNLQLNRLPQVLKLLIENKIEATVSFIIGFPNETESQINQTLLMAMNSKFIAPSFIIQLHYFTFLKGSELYTNVKEKKEEIEFWATDISSLATALPAEGDLVKKYPYIFSSFYSVKYNNYSLRLLQRVRFFFVFLNRFFTHTILELFNVLSITPIQFGQRTIPFFKEGNNEDAHKLGSLLSPHDFTVFMTFIIREALIHPPLMKILAKELYAFGLYGRKLSDHLTIVPQNDEYLLTHGVSGKTMAMKKKLFDEVVENLYWKASPEIEEAKKKLIEILAIVPIPLEEQKLKELVKI
ncbi:MAG: B12-binding domain-containing radical SAM protein [Planctomycetota bacterium]|jgi:radical SAM superfamily enzyme YgiQ (UPF0313 family)